MKTILSIFLFVNLAYGAFSQVDQFRVDCNNVAILPDINSEWSEWFEATNTFVLNTNANNDIIHYRADGEVLIYRNLGGLTTSTTSSGESYQILNVLDEDGNPMEFQLFDNPNLGIKLIIDGMAVQFVNM